MNLETYLDAYDSALEDADWHVTRMGFSPNDEYNIQYKRRVRQYHAFRARILRMDAEKDKEIARLKYDLDWNIDIIEQMRKAAND